MRFLLTCRRAELAHIVLSRTSEQCPTSQVAFVPSSSLSTLFTFLQGVAEWVVHVHLGHGFQILLFFLPQEFFSMHYFYFYIQWTITNLIQIESVNQGLKLS